MFTISTDKARLNFPTLYAYLSRDSYWAQGISEETQHRAIANSVCFGVYEDATNQQVGFARLITDHATFAYLCDVFIVPEFQGRGLGKQLMADIEAYLLPLGCRRWGLVTKDAHGLYEQFGFEVESSGRWMTRKFPDVYG
ncbi:MAG: GNAT family N-acetyltransferase [Armatimonadetes bacterium]|nr:GNAT family N-acetyltransferase [Armatimonadota bacterium]